MRERRCRGELSPMAPAITFAGHTQASRPWSHPTVSARQAPDEEYRSTRSSALSRSSWSQEGGLGPALGRDALPLQLIDRLAVLGDQPQMTPPDETPAAESRERLDQWSIRSRAASAPGSASVVCLFAHGHRVAAMERRGLEVFREQFRHGAVRSSSNSSHCSAGSCRI